MVGLDTRAWLNGDISFGYLYCKLYTLGIDDSFQSVLAVLVMDKQVPVWNVKGRRIRASSS